MVRKRPAGCSNTWLSRHQIDFKPIARLYSVNGKLENSKFSNNVIREGLIRYFSKYAGSCWIIRCECKINQDGWLYFGFLLVKKIWLRYTIKRQVRLDDYIVE